MTHQCKICMQWFHYPEDNPVCRKCYHDFKQFEIYDRNYRNAKDLVWGEEE